MELLRFDALRDVDVCIEDSFLILQNFSDEFSSGRHKHRDRTRRVIQNLGNGLVAPYQNLSRFLVQKSGADDPESLRLEGVGTRPDSDGRCQIVILLCTSGLLGWPDRRPAGDMDFFALRNECIPCQRISVFTADQCSNFAQPRFDNL